MQFMRTLEIKANHKHLVIDVTDMEELSANAGINTVTNCIKGLNNVISSQKSGGMAFFRER